MATDTPPDIDPYEETEIPTREVIDAAVYDERRAEVRVEHNDDQTLVAVETQAGTAVGAIDVGHLPLEREVQLARDLREAFDHATASGGGSDGK